MPGTHKSECAKSISKEEQKSKKQSWRCRQLVGEPGGNLDNPFLYNQYLYNRIVGHRVASKGRFNTAIHQVFGNH